MILRKLEFGSIFNYHETSWMKTTSVFNDKYVCVKLETGELFYFTGEEEVEV